MVNDKHAYPDWGVFLSVYVHVSACMHGCMQRVYVGMYVRTYACM